MVSSNVMPRLTCESGMLNHSRLSTQVHQEETRKMPAIPDKAQTEDSSSFSPDAYFEAWEKGDITAPYDNDFRKFILTTFGLPHDDTYTYAAVAEVTLLQAQTYVEFGGQGGLHAWYRDNEGKPVSPP
jgi:hypothetical protein